jgi:hypothetical protein
MILRRPISGRMPWPGRPRTRLAVWSGKLNSAASNFDRGRWKRFDLFKAALDILKDRGLEASDVVLADAAADLSDCGHSG